MNYKDTLLLPKTEFPMRLSLEDEQAVYRDWESLFALMKAIRRGQSRFVFHDGPPYANGPIHLGHALNKVFKDIVCKRHFFEGLDVDFQPGWDCHGLPIEMKVRDGAGDDLHDRCREYATEQIKLQMAGFKELGVVADWHHYYLTMDPDFEAMIFRGLVLLAKQGLLYEKKKPVRWSWKARTALAEAEIEYRDREDPSIYVMIPSFTPNYHFLIWTTTPWTLPGNQAVALHPDEPYVGVRVYPGENKIAIVGERRLPFLKSIGVVTDEVVTRWEQGKILSGAPLHHKFLDPAVEGGAYVIMNPNADPNMGTGCTHIAPAYGEEDYMLGQKNKLEEWVKVFHPLPMRNYVDEEGRIEERVSNRCCAELANKIIGLHVFQANKPIFEYLKEKGWIHRDGKIYPVTHSYPHCWRTDTPIIFRAAKQWFINVEVIMPQVLKTLEQVEFVPPNQRKRLEIMLRGRSEWCVSRQRKWGVPIALFKRQGTLVLDDDVTNNVASIIEQEGCGGWWSRPKEYWLPPHLREHVRQFERVEDTLDVWFDSGMTWNAIGWEHPHDLYIEGHDQHRGWFQSSLLLAVALTGKAPYKKVVTHGFVLNTDGEKMAKSKGNAVSPAILVKRYGAEVVRTWVASSDYHKDMNISEVIMANAAEDYRKLRNTFRFLLSNLDDSSVGFAGPLMPVDEWILSVLSRVYDGVDADFGKYDFYSGVGTLKEFLRGDLNSIYFNAIKDSLYCDDIASPTRRSHQFALAVILRSLLGLAAPVWTYTAAEVFKYAPGWFKGDNRTLFNMSFQAPAFTSGFDGHFWKRALTAFHEKWDQLKREKGVRDTLEAWICLSGRLGELGGRLGEFLGMADWFVVSRISNSLSDGTVLDSFKVDGKEFWIVRSPLDKCPRCWKYTRLAESRLCTRCQGVIREADREADREAPPTSEAPSVQ